MLSSPQMNEILEGKLLIQKMFLWYEHALNCVIEYVMLNSDKIVAKCKIKETNISIAFKSCFFLSF